MVIRFNLLIISTAILTLLTACQSSQSYNAEAAKKTMAENVFIKSGLKSGLQSVPKQFNKMIQSSQLSSAPAQIQGLLLVSAQEAFNTEEALNTCQETLETQLSTSELVALNNWYNTDMAREIKLAEDIMNEPGSQSRLAEAAKHMQDASPSYRELMSNLLYDSGEIDKLQTHISTAIIALNLAIISTQEKLSGKSYTEDELKVMKYTLEIHAQQLAESQSTSLLPIFILGYKDVPMSSLQKYIDIKVSKPGKNYSNQAVACIKKMFNNFNSIYTDKLEALIPLQHSNDKV